MTKIELKTKPSEMRPVGTARWSGILMAENYLHFITRGVRETLLSLSANGSPRFRARVARQPFSAVGPPGGPENDALWAHCASTSIKVSLLKVKTFSYLKIMLWKMHNPESSLGSHVWKPQISYFSDT